ncbi:cytochrome c biogenesis protein CcdA [Bradyrhizobium sp. AZCC 2262]|uniref:hypothetical protein n=1 Tax=Bradyrhizobium sp. AZCC 2262 TaxID=3117022 RepID=UPI002FEF6A05
MKTKKINTYLGAGRNLTLSNAIKRWIGAVSDFRKARPKEFYWSIFGAAAGFLIGLLVGGVGVAALGGAIGVSAYYVLPVVGVAIGNRVGIWRDRAAIKKVAD